MSGQEGRRTEGAELAAEELEAKLGHRFSDRSLFETALCHSSYANETQGIESNERLEFLGDAVIGLAVAHELFVLHPEWREGDLTRALHQLVDRRALAELARRLDVGPHLRLGRTERQSSGAQKDSILANAMEALLGAMYLDGGLAPVEALLAGVYHESLREDAPRAAPDPKTAFQEAVMARFGVFPSYQLLEDTNVEGDEERFSVEVTVQGARWAVGAGRTKRAAEQRAAGHAHLRMEDQSEEG